MSSIAPGICPSVATAETAPLAGRTQPDAGGRCGREGKFEITAELPGLDEKDVEVKLVGNSR